MCRILLLLSVLLLDRCASLAQDEDLIAIGKGASRSLMLDAKTGAYVEIPATGPRDGPLLVWDCTTTTGYYTDAKDRERLDWGDLNNNLLSSITAFEFGYCSGAAFQPDPNNNTTTIQIAFYRGENGQNTPMPPSQAAAVFIFDRLPGAQDPNEFPCDGDCCPKVLVNLPDLHAQDPNFPASLDLSSPDLDGDGLGDFGYSYFTVAAGPTQSGGTSSAGPLIRLPTSPIGALGADINRYDRFNPPGKWQLGNSGYVRTVRATGTSQGVGDYGLYQYHLQLYALCAAGDADQDGICDEGDNCPSVSNPSQSDCDHNGIGDACDANAPDQDQDGICDPNDNCPAVVNPNQADADGDWVGDACDGCPQTPGLQPCGCASCACTSHACDCVDINGDCRVDLFDLALILSSYGLSTPPVNGDCMAPFGAVDLFDLGYLLSAYGRDCSH